MRPRSRLLKASRGWPLLPGGASMSVMVMATVLVSGCGLSGDFDRVRPSLATDEANARIARDAVARSGRKPSDFPLTDDARRLRDLGRAIIPQPQDRKRWDTVLREYVRDDILPESPPHDGPLPATV